MKKFIYKTGKTEITVQSHDRLNADLRAVKIFRDFIERKEIPYEPIRFIKETR